MSRNWYDDPAEAVNVTEPPWQNVVGPLAVSVATAAGLIVSVVVAVAAVHAAGPVVVSVRTTEPALMSAAEGAYVAFNVLASGEKMPEPLVV